MAEETSGFLGGAATGFKIGGPVGFIVGGALGSFFGSKAGKKRRDAEYKALVANTKQAYKIGDQTFAGLKKSREDIGKKYKQELASSQARYAASGARLEGAGYQRLLGSVSKTRDAALAETDTQEDKFRKSEAFKFIKQDYEYLTKTNRFSNGPGYNDEGYQYSLRTNGRAGTGFFTDEQKEKLQTLDTSKKQGVEKAFAQYANSINPTFEQYEKFKFGSDDDKAQFESDMTRRINQANTAYDQAKVEQGLREERQRKMRDF